MRDVVSTVGDEAYRFEGLTAYHLHMGYLDDEYTFKNNAEMEAFVNNLLNYGYGYWTQA